MTATKDMSEYVKARRRERRERLLYMRGDRCDVCGGTEKLEFRHRPGTEILFPVSGARLDKKWELILTEQKKCDLLCREHLNRAGKV